MNHDHKTMNDCHECYHNNDLNFKGITNVLALFPSSNSVYHISVTYWGCIHKKFWPDVPWRTQEGCEYDWLHAWMHKGKRRPLIW